MKGILKGKLYDTEKAQFLCAIDISNKTKLNVYKTEKGNIFAEEKDIQGLIVEETLKVYLSDEHCIEAYVEVFGQPEEA